jgi:hypothetical protein
VVLPSRGAIYLGRHQYRADQVLLSDLAVGPPLRCESRGYHRLSIGTRPLHNAEDRTGNTSVPLERATHLSVPYTRVG